MPAHRAGGPPPRPAPEFPTAPLRAHHANMSAIVGRLLDLLSATRSDGRPAGPELLRAQSALERAVLPHAEAEDCFLYPEVARLMANHHATATMTVDHAFVSQYLREMRSEIDAASAQDGGGLTPERLGRLNLAAGRLAGLLRVHFEKEEQVFFPLIDGNMTAEEVRLRIIDPINAMSAAAPSPQPGQAARGPGPAR
mgnify:CR=1 FL=1